MAFPVLCNNLNAVNASTGIGILYVVISLNYIQALHSSGIIVLHGDQFEVKYIHITGQMDLELKFVEPRYIGPCMNSPIKLIETVLFRVDCCY